MIHLVEDTEFLLTNDAANIPGYKGPLGTKTEGPMGPVPARVEGTGSSQETEGTIRQFCKQHKSGS